MTHPLHSAKEHRLIVGVIVVCISVALCSGLAGANPFETLPPGHWAYDALEGLVSLDLGRAYVRQRLSIGAPLTYFDLALWVGDALDALREVAKAHRGGDWSHASLEEIAEAYNDAMGSPLINRDRIELLRSLIDLSSVQLEVLGYTVPRDAGAEGSGEARGLGLAGLFEEFRLRGEGRIRYRDVGGASGSGPAGEAGAALVHSYALHMSGPVSESVRIGAGFSGQTRMGGVESGDFSLSSGGVDIGISHRAIARVGDVTSDSVNPLVLAGADRLSGFQAGMNLGQVESSLLVAAIGSEGAGTDGERGVVAAWDGSVQVNDRLSLGATVASVQTQGAANAPEQALAVFRIGGTYTVFPSLTLAGEMAQESAERRGAVRVGAVLHPIPELTLGAFLYSAEPGYRPLLSRDREVTRLDLSAEVGRWILSFRRQSIVRVSEEGEEDANVTLFALEYPVAPSAVARASHEMDGDDAEASKTAFDIEVRLEQGKVILGYALEIDRRNSESGDTRRTTRASVEHAVGPETRAQAGFLIVDDGGGSETVSNLGVQYELGHASVSLQYEIFTHSGDSPKNVTTAEVAIRF